MNVICLLMVLIVWEYLLKRSALFKYTAASHRTAHTRTNISFPGNDWTLQKWTNVRNEMHMFVRPSLDGISAVMSAVRVSCSQSVSQSAVCCLSVCLSVSVENNPIAVDGSISTAVDGRHARTNGLHCGCGGRIRSTSFAVLTVDLLRPLIP